jgi:hypothetical protein
MRNESKKLNYTKTVEIWKDVDNCKQEGNLKNFFLLAWAPLVYSVHLLYQFVQAVNSIVTSELAQLHQESGHIIL